MPASWGGDWTREARDRWREQVESGSVVCHLCILPIRPGDRWDIDHLVPLAVDPERMRDPSNQRPAHASCNRSRGAAMGNRARDARRAPAAPRPARSEPPGVVDGVPFAAWVESWRHPDTPGLA